ncbi:hypothetical protein NKG94_06715 [Micromonospora sp. M12]
MVRAGEAVCFAGDQYRYAEVGRRALALRRPSDPPAIEVMSCLIAGVAATLRGDHERAGPRCAAPWCWAAGSPGRR